MRTHEYLTALADWLLIDGPASLTPVEKRTLLWDADAMQALHGKLWRSPPARVHDWWQEAYRIYNESVRRNIFHSIHSY